MELIESLKYSLEKQSRKQDETLYPSSERDYIDSSLTWSKTIEGRLFWNILHNSYYYYGTYDYVTLVKLYHVFGRDVFKYEIYTLPYYTDNFDKTTYTLTDEGFELLCKELEENGAIRKS